MIIEKALLTEKEKKRAKSSLELQIIKNQKEHEYILSFGKKFGYNTERWEFREEQERLKNVSEEDKNNIKQDILADVQEILTALTKEDVDRLVHTFFEENKGMHYEYSDIYVIIFSVLTLQNSAYQFYGFPESELIELSKQKAVEFDNTPPYKDSDNEKNNNIFETLKELPSIERILNPDKYYLPTYKINDVLFNGDFPIGIEKKVGMTSEKDKRKGKLAYTLLMLNFDELGDGVKISRELSVYDQQVWNACTNLMINNHDIITPSQIYRWMGYEKKMSQTDKDRIMESINTIIRARVSINNENERKLYPKYPEISINEPLLAATIRTAKYGNNEVTAIEILSMPKLFSIAEERGQVTTIPFELLEVPISKTDDNLQLLTYLVRRIIYMKHDSDTSRKILLNAVHSKCKIEDKKQKQRLPEKLQRILGHYKSIGWIADYNLTASQIEIKLPKKK